MNKMREKEERNKEREREKMGRHEAREIRRDS